MQPSKRRRKTKAQDESIDDTKLWGGELGQYIEDDADDSVSVEDLRLALSVIPSSMAAEISAERDR